MKKINGNLIFSFYLLYAAISDAEAQTGGHASTPAAVVVSELYRDYAWEIIFTSPVFKELVDESKGKLENYFSPSLTALILEDRSCVEKTGDACNLDFDPIFASQDRGSVHELSVDNGVSGDDVRVQFKTSSLAAKTELHFKMLNTPSGWRIDDIFYKKYGRNLKMILTPK